MLTPGRVGHHLLTSGFDPTFCPPVARDELQKMLAEDELRDAIVLGREFSTLEDVGSNSTQTKFSAGFARYFLRNPNSFSFSVGRCQQCRRKEKK